jgi:hypothetical protein
MLESRKSMERPKPFEADSRGDAVNNSEAVTVPVFGSAALANTALAAIPADCAAPRERPMVAVAAPTPVGPDRPDAQNTADLS